MPSTPTNVSAQSSYSTALISWSSGGTGVGGNCASSEYYVTVYDMSKRSLPVAAESLPITDGTSWYVDGLSPGTWYFVEVEAYGSACDDYSPDLGTARFATTWGGGSVTKPANVKKRKPAPVRNLQASKDPSTGNLVVTWTKPKAAQASKRCLYIPSGGDHAAKSIEYNYLVEDLTSGTDIADTDFSSADDTLSRTISSNVPSGTGYYIRVTVSAYSEECDHWSPQRTFTFWI
ncbi:fibronectin type III domain-containing protein [Candidatus Poriferisocius sp.]|uniref:fibronectin type III domain-containing protein n=1 Tax=Candidatus Poriferisocius sp. TaxID=3101276 RepID=UPI003B02B0FF